GKIGKISLDGALTLFGYLCVFCALAGIVATVADRREEARRASWPAATAVVRRCDVERVYSRIRNSGGPQWHVQCHGRITVAGQPIRVSFRSHGVNRASEIEDLRAWVARHGKGTSVAVRYDPDRPQFAVPNPSSMPYSGSRVPDDVDIAVLFAAGGT